MSNTLLFFHDIPVIATVPISVNEFETLEEFKTLAEKQNLQMIIVTQQAWDKYESMLFSEEEIQNMTEKE